MKSHENLMEQIKDLKADNLVLTNYIESALKGFNFPKDNKKAPPTTEIEESSNF